MKALLLTAPAKTTEEVDWAKPLNNYLLSVYGNTTEFQDDLAKFSDLRQNIQAAAAGTTNDDSTNVGQHLNYYSQLELLDLRIPMLTLSKRKLVKFTWNDAFDHTEEYLQTSLAYEKACVLFNLASLLMKVTALKYNDANKNPGTETGENAFKEAIQTAQQASGVFQYLSESFLHGPLADLKPSTVKFLASLCLAQNQEMFTLKVIDGDLEQKKNSLISKLCASAAKYYEDAHTETAHLVDEDGVSVALQYTEFDIKETGLDDEILGDENDQSFAEFNPESNEVQSTKVYAHLNASWIGIFRVKQLYYRSLTYYFQGLQLESGKKFGEAIAFLTKSSEFLGQISPALLKIVAKSRGYNVYDLLDNIEYQKDALKIKLSDITKDNDLIYHDIVPSIVTLVEPKAMNSAKAIPMNKIDAFVRVNEKNYNNFLNKVVPVSIHELLSFYSEEKSQFLRNEIDAADISNEELSSVLEFLNLPRALVSIKELTMAENPLANDVQESFLDQESLRKVLEISSNYAQDTANRNTIAQTRKNILDVVSKTEGLLNSALSSTSYGQFREDLIKLKRSLYDAANSDSRLFALIDQDNSAFYQTLAKGVNSPEFKHLFQMPETTQKNILNQEPEISLLDVDDSQLSQMSVTIEDKIRRLEDLLNELNVLKVNKAKLISELKKQIHEDDIADILLINSRVKSTNEIKTVIFPEELRKFDVFLNNLNKLIDQQKALMGDVRGLWQELISSPKVKEIQNSSVFRNGLLKEQKSKIDGFYENNWRRYTVGLQKGVGFYQQLLDYVRGLQNAVERQTQMGLFTQSMGSLNLTRDTTGGSVNSFASQHAPHYSAPPIQDKAQTGWPTGSYLGQVQGQQSLWSQTPGGGNPGNFLGLSYNAPPNAPQLPPKRPSQGSISGHQGSFSGMSSHSPGAGIQPAKPTSPFGSGKRPSGSGSGLIYDQPSTYEPNMYDYFTQNRG